MLHIWNGEKEEIPPKWLLVFFFINVENLLTMHNASHAATAKLLLNIRDNACSQTEDN